jgi:TRAP-type C4-dicarboxylate transport system permease small subunit
MFESFKQIDTPLEYGESAVAVFLIGLRAGSWLGKFIYGFMLGILFLGLLAIPIWEIANGSLSGWRDISLGSVGLGLIIGIVLFPLYSLSNAYQRIEALENKIKLTENNRE